MTAAQIVLGLALLSLGVGMIAGSQRIGRRHRRRSNTMMSAPVLWLFLGTLLAMNGLLLLLLGLA
jgi:hypothetical protein